MQYTNLGRTGLKVSRLCLGTMTFGWSADEASSHEIMSVAVEHGINFFDTADIYSRWVEGNPGGVSEEIIGRWLRGQDRHKIIIATKVRGRMWDGPNGEGLSRHHIMRAVEDSLRRLGTDYIDLYQVHWPDAETPLNETLSALDALVTAGKVRYIGASNYPAWLLMKSLWVSDVHNSCRFETLQPHYSLFNRAEFERELTAVCEDQRIGVIPYSPLAAGFLTGKYTRENRDVDTTRANSGLIKRLVDDPQAYAVVDLLAQIAAAHSVSIGQIALAWLLKSPVVVAPIIGARTVDQLTQITGAVDVSLSDEEFASMSEITQAY